MYKFILDLSEDAKDNPYILSGLIVLGIFLFVGFILPLIKNALDLKNRSSTLLSQKMKLEIRKLELEIQDLESQNGESNEDNILNEEVVEETGLSEPRKSTSVVSRLKAIFYGILSVVSDILSFSFVISIAIFSYLSFSSIKEGENLLFTVAIVSSGLLIAVTLFFLGKWFYRKWEYNYYENQ